MALDRGAQRLLKMLAATGQGAGATRTPAERRRGLESLSELFESPPDAVVEASDLTLPGPGGPLGARLYAPSPAHPRESGDPGVLSKGAADGEKSLGSRFRGNDRVESAAAQIVRPEQPPGLIVYFHGGGWVAGSLATHDGVCRRLASSAGLKVLAVDYRLAPEHPFPAAFEDALAAVRWAGANAEALGCNRARLVVAGDSAGAGLAAAVAQSADRPPLALQLLICPILNLAEDSASRRAFAEGYFLDPATMAADRADYCGGRDLRDPRLSPLLAESLTGAPPALIHTAEYDPFRDEGEAYARRLRDAGVAVRQTRHGGMIHYFYALPRAIPYAAEALAGIGAEIGSA